MKSQKYLFIFLSLAVLSVSVLILHIIFDRSILPVPLSSLPPVAYKGECLVQPEKVTVKGYSLSGFIMPEETVNVLMGYYDCHEPQRGDVVIYLYGSEALIKIVEAVSGDKIELVKNGGSWNIDINGEPLKTTVGIPYAINESVFNVFSRYVDGVNGVLPTDTYMILGNLPAGSIDSTHFGFVRKQSLIGKVLR